MTTKPSTAGLPDRICATVLQVPAAGYLLPGPGPDFVLSLPRLSCLEQAARISSQGVALRKAGNGEVAELAIASERRI